MRIAVAGQGGAVDAAEDRVGRGRNPEVREEPVAGFSSEGEADGEEDAVESIGSPGVRTREGLDEGSAGAVRVAACQAP